MLLELCVTELEDVATDSEAGRSTAKPVVQESPHPYTDDSSQTGVVRIPGAESLRIEFNRNCSTERRHDPLTIMDSTGRTIATRSGSLALQIAGLAGSDWPQFGQIWDFLRSVSVHFAASFHQGL